MFTGLVECTAVVASGNLAIQMESPQHFACLGDSIAVNGCCLTVVAIESNRLFFEVSRETIRCTNLGELTVGKRVNLERALVVGSRLGGHFVSGHIDCVGQVSRVDKDGDFVMVSVKIAHPDARLLVIPKGSICWDGVSLTVNSITALEGAIEVGVTLIPATLQGTIFGEVEVGKQVNIEFDMVGKYLMNREIP